jgi:uncharacterized protein (TIGR02145 family)
MAFRFGPPIYITIGTQAWTKRNLETTRYRNGDPIPQVTNATQWVNLTTGAWCYYGNNSANGLIYGKMYNWYAVNDPRGIAPEGYHVPSDSEWTILETFLGGQSVAGGKLRQAGTSLWQSPNTGATNSSGFTGLPGGERGGGGSFTSQGGNTSWWSSTQADSAFAYTRFTFFGATFTRTDTGRFTGGYYVRLIKD